MNPPTDAGRSQARDLDSAAAPLRTHLATLAHVFNHATHHRGQITAAITAMGHACPEIDLVWMLQADATRVPG